jgi:hypothetical protein
LSQILDAAKLLRDSVLLPNEKKPTNPNHLNMDTSAYTVKFTASNANPDKFNQLPLRASEFNSGRTDHTTLINKLGIKLIAMSDGRVQLVHKTAEAASFEDAELGNNETTRYEN